MGLTVRKKSRLRIGASVGASFVLMVLINASSHSYTRKEFAVPNTVKLSSRLQVMFEETKVFCFGRYAIKVPLEAQLIFGSAVLRDGIEVLSGGLEKSKRHADEKFKRLKWEEPTAEISYSGPGPVANSWQVRYFEDKYNKVRNTLFFETYLGNGEITFVLNDSIAQGETEDTVISRQFARAKSLRPRTALEMPTEAGFCIEQGFIPSEQYGDSEKINAGIYLPSLPDVTFSINSNQNAYMDYSKAEYEKIKREELPLLARIKGAQNTQGSLYPKRDVLREGEREVQHWKGEESLIRRPDGTHDFEWALVGTPGDVANPAELHAVMFSKVKANIVGAAKKASISDEEAVALWDKLLMGLKFRVKVPGAPNGSYYLPKNPSVSASEK